MKQIGYPDPKILTGKEMKEMSPAALLHGIPITDVFAEVEPNQKERIIETLRKKSRWWALWATASMMQRHYIPQM
jgi:Mg2+-importing ATPase